MGRTPDTYRNRKITARHPYTVQSRTDAISAQQVVTFPSGSFLYDGDGVVEIHRMVPRVFSVDENGDVLLDLGAAGLALVDVMIRCTAHDNEMTKRATPLAILTLGSEELTWEWPEPIYLQKDQGFVVTANIVDLSQLYATAPLLRIALAFQGNHLVFGAA